MTLLLDTAVHHGCGPLKQTLDDSECINPSILERQGPYEMTRNNDAGHGFTGQQLALDLSSWTLDLPLDGQSFPPTQYFAGSGPDASNPPGRHTHQQSSGRSDDAGSPISQIVYTPSSTHEHDAFANEISEAALLEDEDDSSRSPLSDSIFSSTTDSSFYLVSYPESSEAIQPGRPPSMMNSRPRPAASGASARHSRASSVAKSSTPNHTTDVPWSATLTTPAKVMTNNTSGARSDSFDNSHGSGLDANTFGLQDPQDPQYDLMPHLTLQDHGTANALRTASDTSFRAFDTNTTQMFESFPYIPESPFNQIAPPAQQLREQQHYFTNQYQQSQAFFPQQQLLHNAQGVAVSYAPSNIPVPSSLVADQSAATNPMTPGVAPTGNIPTQSQPPRVVVHQLQPSGSTRAAPYPQSYMSTASQVSTYQHSQHHRRAPKAVVSSQTSTAPSRRVHLAPREDRRPPVVPSNAPAAVVQSSNSRKGGRARNTRLSDHVRQQTSKMRGVTACWRCALQRDKCDDGDICRRCSMRSQKGQRDLFGCDRSKLPEWIEDLLPFSMTDMHSRSSIERFVSDQVMRWNTDNSIDIYLTSGYGPPLIWRCCEFQPRDQELLGQLQYLQEASTGQEHRQLKYSPPFALEKLDENDDAHFQAYLDNQLMHPNMLTTLAWTFYEEECMVDLEFFQAQVLEQICTLFTKTEDPQLREAIQDILRMLIVTYIMGHTLTIAEDTLPTVLASVRYTHKQTRQQPHTSPRLANRQLKHYFSSLRNSTYLKVLHRQQQTFHDSKNKEARWLVSFCAMLGLAMVLEEIQRTIQIQADAKWAKGEMTREHAEAEALGHCQRIDEKFERLIFYFQKKYRDRKWGDNGSFGRGTPEYSTVAEKKFLEQIYHLLLYREDHLRSRERVPLGPEYQCKYTTRLVAKFLLPFLNLAT